MTCYVASHHALPPRLSPPALANRDARDAGVRGQGLRLRCARRARRAGHHFGGLGRLVSFCLRLLGALLFDLLDLSVEIEVESHWWSTKASRDKPPRRVLASALVCGMSVLQRENIDPMDLSTSSKGPNYWKTPANTLDDAACSGWLEKEGHMVKNWRRRWFVLWPASGSSWAQKHAESRWAQTHGSERTQQLLLYYESEESSAPKGIVPLQPGRFEIASEAGGPYRGEETLVLSVQAEAAVHSRYVIRSEEPGDPGDLPRACAGPRSICEHSACLSV